MTSGCCRSLMRSVGGTTVSSRSGRTCYSVWCLRSCLRFSLSVERAVFDQVAYAAGAEPLAKSANGVADHGRVGPSPHRGVAWHVEHGPDLTEIISGGRNLQQFLTAGQFAKDLELAVG